MRSPPLSPIQTRTPSSEAPAAASPTHSYKSHKRRTSSFSIHHDRSPMTPRSQHRFSNASAYSSELRTPVDEYGSAATGGLGNLADELDQLDNEDEEDDLPEEEADGDKEAIRDSGIDVSYLDKSEQESQLGRLQSKPPDPANELDESFSPDLEDAISDIARLAKQSSTAADMSMTSFTKSLQDLGNQAAMESGLQRMNTSVNSMSAHLTKETRTVQLLSTSLLSPFGFRANVDEQMLDDSMASIDALVHDLPQPDAQCSQDLQKLSHENDVVVSTLTSLMDTLQMGKQTTNTASRHLRTTQTMVADLLKERDRGDIARVELGKSDVEQKIAAKWHAKQCRDIVSGFERHCDELWKTHMLSAKADA